MDDRSTRRDGRGDSGDEAVARLLRLAGPRPAAPARTQARVRAAAHSRWLAVTRRRRNLVWGSWLALSIAAAATAWVTIGAGLWRALGLRPGGGSPVATVIRVEGAPRSGGGGPASAGAGLPAGAVLATGDGDRAAIRMEGGALLRLDRVSVVRVLSGVALALDRGAVYLDSRPRGMPASPIVIHAAGGTVRHVGTRLEVRVTGSDLLLTVRDGIGRLEKDGGAWEAGPGTRLSVGGDGIVSRSDVPAHGPEWDWILDVAPAFDIEGRSLEEFLRWLAAETGWRIEFTDPAMRPGAGTIVLHGSIAGLRPDQAPAAILPTCGLRHRVDGGTLFIEPGGNPGTGSTPPTRTQEGGVP